VGRRALAVVAGWRAWLRTNAVGLALAGVAIAWRAAVRSRSLVTFDAGLHANGLRSYDIPSGQPHPPGYPLDVLAGRIVDVVVQDPIQSMVWLSVLWTGLTTFLVWRLGERMGGRGAGIAASLLFLASPLALLHGASGLTYASDAAMGAAVAAAAWSAGHDPSRRRLLALGAVLAIAVGVRPSALLFLAPLALWPALRAATWRQRRERIGWVAASAVPIAVAWIVPMLVFGGGLQAVLAANKAQSRTVVFTDTVFTEGLPGVRGNVAHLAEYAAAELRALPWMLAAVGVALASAGRRGWDLVRANASRAAFLALWALPALAFYAFIYVGWPVYPPGYLMVVLPPVVLGLAIPLVAGLGLQQGRRRVLAAVACILVVAVPLAHAPAAWHDGTRPIRDADAWADSWRGLGKEFPADSSAIVMTESWQHVKLEHPEYLAWVRARYDHREGEVYTRGIVSQGGVDSPRWFELVAMDPEAAPMHAIPSWVERIVLHEGHPYTGPETLVKDSVVLNETTLPSGRVVRWFTPLPEWRAIESYFPDVDPDWAEAKLRAQEGGGG
jgi:hypothetical protein